MTCRILRLFAKTLTAYEKDSLINRDILTKPIEMKVSQGKESTSGFFASFSKSILNFQYFQKNDDSDSPYISEIAGSETRG